MSGQKKIIKDTINSVYLQNDILDENATTPQWGADTTAFEYADNDVAEVIELLNGASGQFIGQNPPPR